MLETYSGEVTSQAVVPPRASSDDLQILPDSPSGHRRLNPSKLWLLLLFPWAWFLLRGVHPSLELIAILLPLIIAGTFATALLVAAYFRSLPILGLAISLMPFYIVAVLLPGQPTPAAELTETTRVASINLASQFFTDDELGFYIYERQPDIFFGIELRETHGEELQRRYDHFVTDLAGQSAFPPFSEPDDRQTSYRGLDSPSIGLYSRFSIERLGDPLAGEIAGGLPGFRARVQTDSGPLIVYALHFPRPGTGNGIYEVSLGLQDEILQATLSAIAAEDDPVVVLGDLNIVDRGAAYGDLTEDLRDAMRTERWAGPTRGRNLFHTSLQLRIDHVLVSDELCVADAQSPDVLFSDHTPVQADIGLCPTN